ncbi:MAG: hypothetical protein VX313_02280, partial [Bacteroidota bacterium]|nr:hypothetical protein [Bacteroidota bacterium]
INLSSMNWLECYNKTLTNENKANKKQTKDKQKYNLPENHVVSLMCSLQIETIEFELVGMSLQNFERRFCWRSRVVQLG